MKPITTISHPAKPEPKAEQDTPPDDQRVLWLAVRRGLLVIVKAIETKYDVGEGKKAA